MSHQLPSFIEVIDPGRYSLEESERLARQLMAAGEWLPERFVSALEAKSPPDTGRSERMLQLLPRITPVERLLPLLNRILPSSHSRIRSKAWKLYAAASADLEWAKSQIEDGDPRVAANVVEALWRAAPSEALREIFRQAARQRRNRVAGNGLVGLCLCGDPGSFALIAKFAEDVDPDFRASAAWVIGRVYWRQGIGLLQQMRSDKNEKVRRNAKRSLARILRRHPDAA